MLHDLDLSLAAKFVMSSSQPQSMIRVSRYTGMKENHFSDLHRIFIDNVFVKRAYLKELCVIIHEEQ